MALLDTTALIDLSRQPSSSNWQRVTSLIGQLVENGQLICTSRINEAEFRVGGFWAANPVLEVAKVNAVLSTVVILEFDAVAAMRYAQVQAQLLTVGRPAGGQADLMIAAVALANGQSLVTRNAKHFATVPGLTVLTY